MAQSASDSAKKLSSLEFVNSYELSLFNAVKPDISVMYLSRKNDNGILIDFLSTGVNWRGRNACVVDSFKVRIVFIKTHE